MKWVMTMCLSVAMIAGCQQNPWQRLNSPPQGQSSNRSAMQAPFAAMTNNAVLADMSVTDIHFAGPTAELNGTGQVRMQRLAKILKTYGGELNYTTSQPDQKLVQARLNRLEDYLASAGVDMNKVTVRHGLPASEGMTAAEAIKAQQAPMASSGAGGAAAAAPSGLMPAGPGSGGGAAK